MPKKTYLYESEAEKLKASHDRELEVLRKRAEKAELRALEQAAVAERLASEVRIANALTKKALAKSEAVLVRQHRSREIKGVVREQIPILADRLREGNPFPVACRLANLKPAAITRLIEQADEPGAHPLLVLLRDEVTMASAQAEQKLVASVKKASEDLIEFEERDGRSVPVLLRRGDWKGSAWLAEKLNPRVFSPKAPMPSDAPAETEDLSHYTPEEFELYARFEEMREVVGKRRAAEDQKRALGLPADASVVDEEGDEVEDLDAPR